MVSSADCGGAAIPQTGVADTGRMRIWRELLMKETTVEVVIAFGGHIGVDKPPFAVRRNGVAPNGERRLVNPDVSSKGYYNLHCRLLHEQLAPNPHPASISNPGLRNRCSTTVRTCHHSVRRS